MIATNRSPGVGRPACIGALNRGNRLVRRVALQWRRLTGAGDSPTLVACSGGADSTALVLALALASKRIVVGHVLHDLRPPAEAEEDRDAVRDLAAQLGLEFRESEVRVASRSGNVEGVARRERYAALARLASLSGCAFVATAHHADDQMESVLMALIRGSGPRGLRGIAPRRALDADAGITLIRPMLGVTRNESQSLCRAGGIGWREDATNRDTTRLRAALRHDVLPLIQTLRPTVARRICRAAESFRDLSSLVDERIQSVFGDGLKWPRSALRDQPALIIGGGLRRAAIGLCADEAADRLNSRLVDEVVLAIQGTSTEPREFHWPRGVRVSVTAHEVSMARA